VSGSVPPRSDPFDGPNVEALTLAMAIAPTAYSRNKMFALFRDARVGRARSRARLVRSLALELSRSPDATVETRALSGERVALTVRVERLQYSRNAELSQSELSVLRYLCDRARVTALPCEPQDQALVEKVLLKLAAGLIG
jgi:hypothetical protein